MDRWPVHLPAIAAYPVLWLWARNATEVGADDVWPFLAQALLAAVVVTLLALVAFRDLRRAALLASAVTGTFLAYGHVLGGRPPWLGLALWLVALVAVTIGIARMRPVVLSAVTRAVNVAAAALVVTAAVPLVGEFTGARVDAAAEPAADVTVADAGAAPLAGRDIWYVILDRYGREDSLREVFGHDNSAWTRFLERRGFDVLDGALANYPKTAHSLAASLNLDYLDDLARRVPADAGDDWGPVYAMLADHRLGRLVTAAGYEYVHVGNWWSPTATAATADRVLTYDEQSEFGQVLELTTALPTLREAAGIPTATDPRRLKYDHAVHQFEVLERLAADRGGGPRFVLAHIALPHEPYVFEPDGTYVELRDELRRDRATNFVNQLAYTNRRMRSVVDGLLSGRAPDEAPIVVIQADEGMHPVAYVEEGGDAYQWLDAPPEELREKLRILAAVHLPGVDDAAIPEDLTPVNIVREVVSQALGPALPRLPDVAYVFPDHTRLYDFHDVTDRVRGG